MKMGFFFSFILFIMSCTVTLDRNNLKNTEYDGEKSDSRTDSSQWMEADAVRLRQWIMNQNNQTKKASFLDSEIFKEAKNEFESLDGINSMPSMIQVLGDNLYFLKASEGEPLPSLFTLNIASRDIPRKVIDSKSFPNEQALHFYSVNPYTSEIFYGLAEDGNEVSSLKVLASNGNKRSLADVDRLVDPMFSFLPDGKSFFYQRHDNRLSKDLSERYKGITIRLHSLQEKKEQDLMVASTQVPANPAFRPTDRFRSIHYLTSSKTVVLAVRDGISGSFRLYKKLFKTITDLEVPWLEFVGEQQGVVMQASDNRSNLYLVQPKNRVGYELIRINLDSKGDAKTDSIYVSNKASPVHLSLSNEAIFLIERTGLESSVVRLDFSGKISGSLNAQTGHEFSDLFSNSSSNSAVVEDASFGYPDRFFLWNGKEKKYVDHLKNTSLPSTSVEVEIDYATSGDGTRVPYWLVRDNKTRFSSNTPILVDVYGAYGDITRPSYSYHRNFFLKKGGAIVYCMVRGGGELGPSWHDAAKRKKKINSGLDAAACLEDVIQKGRSSSNKIAVYVSSAGGLVGAYLINFHSDKFNAIVTNGAITNVTNLNKIPIGVANKGEFGDPEIPEELEVLRKLDAVDSVYGQQRCLSVLSLHGYNDSRVPVWMSSRFVSRMQERCPDSGRVYLFADFSEGHGVAGGARQRSTRWAMIMGFLFSELK